MQAIRTASANPFCNACSALLSIHTARSVVRSEAAHIHSARTWDQRFDRKRPLSRTDRGTFQE